MDPRELIELVTEDEGLTGDLDDEGASCLVREMSDAARKIAASSASREEAENRAAAGRKNGRVLARMAAKVQDGDLESARTLAAAQGWAWPREGAASAADLIGAFRDKLAG